MMMPMILMHILLVFGSLLTPRRLPILPPHPARGVIGVPR